MGLMAWEVTSRRRRVWYTHGPETAGVSQDEMHTRRPQVRLAVTHRRVLAPHPYVIALLEAATEITTSKPVLTLTHTSADQNYVGKGIVVQQGR